MPVLRAGGQGDWRQLLQAFWTALEQATKNASAFDRMEVQAALDAALGPLIFPPQVTTLMVLSSHCVHLILVRTQTHCSAILNGELEIPGRFCCRLVCPLLCM